MKRANDDLKELRRDVHLLALTVADIKSELRKEKETTKLVLDGYERDANHSKESIGAKFDVLTTRLDAKIVDFERRLSKPLPHAKRKLKQGSDD